MPIETGINRLLDFELKANKGVANGYCDLDALIKVPLTRLYTGGGAGLDADTVDLKHAADFLLLAGGVMTGNIDFSGAQLHMNDNYISLGYQTGLQAIGGGVPKDLTFYDSTTPGGVTLTSLIGGSGADHGGLLGLGDDDHLQYLPLTAGSGRALTGDLYIDGIDLSIGIKQSGTLKGIITAYSWGMWVHAQAGSKLTIGSASPTSPTEILGTPVTIATLGNDLIINKVTPILHLHEGGISNAILAWQSGVGTALNSEIGDLTLTASESTAKSVILSIFGTTKLTIANAAITATVPIYINRTTPIQYFQEAADSKLAVGWQNGPGGAINNLSGNLTIINNSADIYIDAAVAGKNIYLQRAGTSKLTIGLLLTANTALYMSGYKITALAAATADGDAVRFEQIVTYSMEVADNNVGINPADSSTYYFGHIGVAASTTANAQSHLRMIPRTGIITNAMIMMYATIAGTSEGISVYIRKNNTTDYLVATVSGAVVVRSFSNTALNIAVTAGDNIEIKIIYPGWVTNPLVVTWDGTLIITS